MISSARKSTQQETDADLLRSRKRWENKLLKEESIIYKLIILALQTSFGYITQLFVHPMCRKRYNLQINNMSHFVFLS